MNTRNVVSIPVPARHRRITRRPSSRDLGLGLLLCALGFADDAAAAPHATPSSFLTPEPTGAVVREADAFSLSRPGIGDDAARAFKGLPRRARQEPTHLRRARAEAQERDRKRLMKKRKAQSARNQGAKIGVSQTGIYYVGVAEVEESGGLNLPRQWKNSFGLSGRGQDVTILPSSDATGFYFYGTEPASNLEPDSIYRLSNNGPTLMRSRKNPPRTPRPTGAEVFTRTVQVEQNLFDVNNASSDPDGDTWVWDYVVSDYRSAALPFRADGAAPGRASVTVRLKGGPDSPGSPDQHASISLNDACLGEVFFDGEQEVEAVLEFEGRLLSDGPNVLHIEGLADTAAFFSFFYVDSFDVTYQSRYRASENRGEFAAAGNASVFISGFTRSDISVFDITNPNEPVLVAAPVNLHTDGTYGAVVASAGPSAVYYAVTPDAVRSASRVLPDAPSSLKTRNNRGEYLVITTEALMDTAQDLADHRPDLVSQVIDIEDIYDEFNFGNTSPYALRDFLAYARSKWRSAPRYVVLAGDGTYDYKNAQDPDNNLIPVRLSNTPLGLYQDDSWFVAPSSASQPGIALGRLPVTSTDELAEVIRKIVAREAALGEPWMQNALLLADNPDPAGDFVQSLEGVASVLPPGTPVVRAYFTTDGVWGSRAKLINGLNSGTGFVSYFGHAGFDYLADEGVFGSWDTPLLTNASQPAVMTAMTCLAGNSSLPGTSSLGEIMVRQPGGGLVALWGPSGWSENHLAEPLANEFYRAAFDPGTTRLGDAVQASRDSYAASGLPAYMLSIYNLLGDPALRLR